MQKQYVGNWGQNVEAVDTGQMPRTAASVVGLRETLSLIVRRRNFVLAFTLVCSALVAIAVYSMRDVYTADAALVLERNDARLLEAVTQLENEQRDRSAIETEMDIITSRVFAGRVVDAMNLVQHPWFNTYLPDDNKQTQSTLPGRMIASVTSGIKALFGLGSSDANRKLPNISTQRDAAISSLVSNLSVNRNGDSFAVTVTVNSPDPELSAALANTVTTVYVDWSREIKRDSMADAVNFLRERASQIASRIAANEREITDFSRLNDLSSDERDDLLRKRIDEMNSQLTAARVELAGIRASREQGNRVISGEEEIEGTALQSPLLTTLRGEQATLVRQRAQLASNFAAGHPQILETDAQLASVQTMINGEIKRIVDDLSGEEKVVNDRVKQIEEQIAELQTTVRKRSLAEIRLRELERDLLADQKLHDLVVARLGGLDPFAEVSKPSARVVSIAEVPTGPSFPQRERVLMGGIVGSAVLAIILAVMFEASDNRVRSAQRIIQLVQLPNLGNIPGGNGAWFRRPMHVLRQLMARPHSISAEAFRSLYLACRGQLTLNKTVLLITAPLPRDGTTSVALGLAFCAARDGVKTLYVDLDLQPSHVPVGGLVDASANKAETSVENSGSAICGIRPVPSLDRLDILTSAALRERRQPGSVLGSGEIKRLLDNLRALYDLVIVDTAPVLIVEDANWLSPYVDATLLVVRFGQTTEQELIGAVDRLRMNRASLLGTVLNNVDPRGRSTGEPLGAISYPRLSRGYFVD